jgi:hypothetical protein
MRAFRQKTRAASTGKGTLTRAAKCLKDVAKEVEPAELQLAWTPAEDKNAELLVEHSILIAAVPVILKNACGRTNAFPRY